MTTYPKPHPKSSLARVFRPRIPFEKPHPYSHNWAESESEFPYDKNHHAFDHVRFSFHTLDTMWEADKHNPDAWDEYPENNPRGDD